MADVLAVEVDAAAGVDALVVGVDVAAAVGVLVVDAVVAAAEQVGVVAAVVEVDIAAVVDAAEQVGVVAALAEAVGLLVRLHLAVCMLDKCGSTTAYIPLHNSMDYYNLDIDSF